LGPQAGDHWEQRVFGDYPHTFHGNRAFIDPSLSETAKPLLPKDELADIGDMKEWVYSTINTAVYKCGFASSQEACTANVYPLFQSLDRLEAHLTEHKTSFLFGEHITEADIRFYPTIARFDVGYCTLFKCNLKSIRHDYPRLHKWLRILYWEKSQDTNGAAFGSTTHFTLIKAGYTYPGWSLKQSIVPAGHLVNIMSLD